jgi:putative DNA methylase
MTVTRKKLIEVALPLEAINEEGSRRKRKAPAGYPTTLHKWWAQRPVAAARAVIFSQMVDDPSSHPELWPTDEEQDRERQRLFRLIEQLVLWENTTNEAVLQPARDEIWRSWRWTCEDNKADALAAELYNPDELPAFRDPFAGSGTLPMEAQRLGLEGRASDLNPVAVLISKAMIEIAPKFASQPPVNPDDSKRLGSSTAWKDASGLAADVRHYGNWIGREAAKRLGHLYPKVLVSPEMAADRPDLKPYLGRELTVAAWLWARTVKSPNPAFRDVDVPLASSFVLSTRPGKEAYVEPVLEGRSYRFIVRAGRPRDASAAQLGTKLSRGANFRCLMTNEPIASEHIYAEAQAGRMGARLMAIVAEGDRGRVYLSPTRQSEIAAGEATPGWRPDLELPKNPRWFSPPLYGLTTYGDLFTNRQAAALRTFSALVSEAAEQVRRDACAAGLQDDGRPLDVGGVGALGYAEAVAVYLAFALARVLHYGSTICTWLTKDAAIARTFTKQAIPMTWDFAEGNVFGKSSTEWLKCVDVVATAIAFLPTNERGIATLADAASDMPSVDTPAVISTDPPYFDNIGYADLSDFFYVWLRRSLQEVFPGLFTTVATPKADELVATPYRHGGKEAAEKFFLAGMTKAMGHLAEHAHRAFPITIYYAFKQSETGIGEGAASTGWETFLEAVIRAGLTVTGTWPMRTEGDNRLIGIGTNALASSIVLVCRSRPANAPAATRTEFLQELSTALRVALPVLASGTVAPVDLAQASIGPGMAVYSKYSSVVRQDGKPVTVREALQDINAAVDRYMEEMEQNFDSATKFCIAWYDQVGFAEGSFGEAQVLERAKNVVLSTLQHQHLLEMGQGKVRLISSSQYPEGLEGLAERAFGGSAWEACMRLVATLNGRGGEAATAALARELGEGASLRARQLSVRLFLLADKRKRAADALLFNALDASWPAVQNLVAGMERGGQQGRFA